MLVDRAQRLSISPMSAAMASKRWLKSSSRTASASSEVTEAPASGRRTSNRSSVRAEAPSTSSRQPGSRTVTLCASTTNAGPSTAAPGCKSERR